MSIINGIFPEATRLNKASSRLCLHNKEPMNKSPTALYGATKLPKLELYNIVNNLKTLLSPDFINDLKIQIEYLNAA